MATIDELMIKVVLDVESLQQGQRRVEEQLRRTSEQAETRGKQIEAAAGKAADMFRRIRNEVMTLGATLVGFQGVRSFVDNLTSADAAAGRLAQRVGMNVAEIGRWGEAAARFGGSAEATGASIERMSQAFTRFSMFGEGSQIIGGLRQFGIQAQDAHGHMRNIGDVFMDINALFQNKSPQERNVIGQTLGLDQGTIAMLGQSRAELRGMLEQMGLFGTATDKSAEASIKFQQAMLDLKQVATDFGRTVFTDLEPQISKMLRSLRDWIMENRGWLEHDLVNNLKLAATQVIEFGKSVNAVAQALGGWQRVGEAILLLWTGEKLAAMIAGARSFLGVFTAFAATPAGLALMGIGAIAGTYFANKAANEDYDAQAAAMGYVKGGDPHDPTYTKGSEVLNYTQMREKIGHPIDKPEPGGFTDWMHKNIGDPVKNFFSGNPFSPSAFHATREAIAGIEHAGYSQMGGASGRFAGRYQMGADEIRETAASLGEDAPTQQQFLSDPAMQDRFFERYTLNHHKWLLAHSAAYAALSPERQLEVLAYAHNQGAGGAKRWLETGQAGRDAFGTSGARYAGAAHAAMGDPSILRGGDGRGRATTAGASTTTSNTVHIGTVTVQTAATDATGIARDIGKKLRQYAYVAQANPGLA